MSVNVDVTPVIKEFVNHTLKKHSEIINADRKKKGLPEMDFECTSNVKVNEMPKKKLELNAEEIEAYNERRRTVIKIIVATAFIAIAIPAARYLVNETAKLVKASKGLAGAFNG